MERASLKLRVCIHLVGSAQKVDLVVFTRRNQRYLSVFMFGLQTDSSRSKPCYISYSPALRIKVTGGDRTPNKMKQTRWTTSTKRSQQDETETSHNKRRDRTETEGKDQGRDVDCVRTGCENKTFTVCLS